MAKHFVFLTITKIALTATLRDGGREKFSNQNII